MRTMASPERRQSLPKSLVERLALLARGEPLPVPRGGHTRQTADRPRTGLWFGLGVLTSGALGGIALLGLQGLAGGAAWVEFARTAMPAVLAEAAPARPAPHTFDVAIDRSEGAHAPFGLHLAGTDDDNMEVVLQGIPAGARLSRGERRDAATWVVRRGDLAGLHLTLGDAAPSAFDVTIDVVAPPGVATMASVARVRLVDRAPPLQPATPATPGLAEAVAPVTDVAKLPPADVAAPAPGQRRVQAVADAGAAALPWPAGASALGAIPRDSERQVWWTMPAPSWSPFQTAGAN